MKKGRVKEKSEKSEKKTRKPKALKPAVVASGNFCFWVHHGPVLKDLRELHRAFQAMTPEQFAHHVTHDKNDFCAWVMNVLSDHSTAKKLAKARTREEAAQVVESALQSYIS